MKDYFLVTHRLLVLICLTLSFFSNAAIADDRQVIEFYYDLSGNIIEKNTYVTANSVAPSVSVIDPSFVRKNTSTSITVDGTDLKNAQIAGDDPGLIISSINTSNTAVTFDLYVSNEVPLGIHSFIFSTLSGQIIHTIEVYPQLPQMVLRPTPLALAAGSITEVLFGISHADIVDHLITVSIGDTSIISASASTFTITAGERFPGSFFNVTGLSPGSTTLTFSSAQLGEQVFTVMVGNAYQPPPGTQVAVRSDLLGLVLPTNSPDLKQFGPLTSSLSVFLTPGITPDNRALRLQTSTLLSVVFGSAFTQVLPKAIASNSSSLLTINGHGLSDVNGITITPPDGITVGNIQVNQQGTTITASLSVDANVSFSRRSLQLLTAAAEIKPTRAELRYINIGGQAPVIETIAPIVASRLTTQALNVTGQNFDGDVKVTITPPDDISIGNLVTLNGDHTALSVDLNIGEYAALGARIVSIETLNGVTAATSLSTNTLTIANGIVGETPLTSIPLGVLVGSANTVSKSIELFSTELSIVRGAGITSVQPQSSMTDLSVTLTIEGYQLNNVTAVNFEPAQGLTAEAPQIANDGRSLTVNVTVSADALTTARQISVVAGGAELPFIKPEFSRFKILGPVPQIAYILPNFIIAGSTSTITIHGVSFDTVDSVRIDSANGFTVSVPQVNAQKTQVTVQLTADANIQRSTRTVFVSSNSGESSSIPLAVNQLNIVDEELLTINSSLVSPQLGILKGNNPNNIVIHNYAIVSDLLGILIPEPPSSDTESYYARPLSVVKGSYAQSVTPGALEVGATSTVTITGVDLQNVTSIEVSPSDDITVQPTVTINPEATAASVNMAVAANAEKTLRRIIVQQDGNTNNALPFVKAESALIKLAGTLPVIDSIRPVLQVANSQFELLLRGQNLQEVTAVQVYISSGVLEPLIVFGTPVVNVDGTELRVTTIVDRLVSSGAKSIVLTVPIGQTSISATSNNTLTIETVSN